MNSRPSRLHDAEMSLLADSLESWCGATSTPKFLNYDLEPGHVLGVISGQGVPQHGTTTACSFGLSHQDWSSANFPDRCELVTAWLGLIPGFDRVLVAVAREALRSKSFPKPGTVFVDAFKAAEVGGVMDRMPHALIVTPYIWSHGFDVCQVGPHRVWFVQVVPIFELERRRIEERGFASFEEILKFDGAHFTDISRVCHVA